MEKAQLKCTWVICGLLGIKIYLHFSIRAQGMAYFLQGSELFCGFFFTLAYLVSTQPTFHERCGKGNLICSLQGELDNLILAQAKQRRNLEEINAVDCADLYIQGHRKDGVYVIRPRQLSRPIQVFYMVIYI